MVAAYRGWLKLCAWYPGEPLVPAVPVDEAWQTHLADTAKYARDCQAAFGTFAHRYPHRWRDAHWVAWHRNYARTRDLFRGHFGTDMPGAAPPAGEDHHPGTGCCTGGAGSIRVFGDLDELPFLAASARGSRAQRLPGTRDCPPSRAGPFIQQHARSDADSKGAPDFSW